MRRWIHCAFGLMLVAGLAGFGCDGDETGGDDDTGVSVDTGSTDTGPQDTGYPRCDEFCSELADCSIPYPNCKPQCIQGAVGDELISCVREASGCEGVRACYGVSDTGPGGDDGGTDAADTGEPTDTTDTSEDTADGSDGPTDTSEDTNGARPDADDAADG